MVRSTPLLLYLAMIQPLKAWSPSRCAPPLHQRHATTRVLCLSGGSSTHSGANPIYFVMGGPGSGKGTQCQKLVDEYGFLHLSAGDLLRAEVKSGSELGNAIAGVINEGQIVKSETTVQLLQNAMEGHKGPILIDGFPRSLSNYDAFLEVSSCTFMLFLEVSEEEMERRLLIRGETSGRSDDNSETIHKRFRTFLVESMPVVERMEADGFLRRVDAAASEEEVFHRICATFAAGGVTPPQGSKVGAS